MPCSTFFDPKDLLTPLSEILGRAMSRQRAKKASVMK
jgi:hypothetical protein